MNSDVFYKIGSTHKVCQDYAFATNDKIALSDGCSSAALSEMGSRLLCHSYLSPNDGEYFQEGYWKIAKDCVLSMFLPIESLTATLLTAEIVDDWLICVQIRGDGCVTWKDKDGPLRTYDISFETNAPFYPLYYHENMIHQYMEQYGDMCKITHGTVEDCGHYLWDSPGTGRIIFNQMKENIDFVALFSDGINSFLDKNKQSIDRQIVIDKLLDFKNFSGDFVQRRCNRVFKEFSAEGITHFDDFSMAVLKV